MLGQHEKARASYQRATGINPNSVLARNKLIEHHLAQANSTKSCPS